MDCNDLQEMIKERILELNEEEGSKNYSLKSFHERYGALNEILAILNKAIEHDPYQLEFISLKNRVTQSMRLMELALSCGLIKDEHRGN